MPRKPNPIPPQPVVELNHEAIAEDVRAMNQLVVIEREVDQRVNELAVQIGYRGPTETALLEHGIAHEMRRTIDSCLEMGRMLTLLRERVGHGQFEERVTALGFSPRTAQRFMQAALRYAKHATSKALMSAIGSQTKLLEMLVLDDEELSALANGESARGLELDDVETMTVTELRAALRESMGEATAKDKLIEEKNKKIDKLSSYRPSKDTIAKTEAEKALLEEIAKAANAVELAAGRMGAVVADTFGSAGSEAIQARAIQAMQYLVHYLGEVTQAAGIEIDTTTPFARPAWLDPNYLSKVNLHEPKK